MGTLFPDPWYEPVGAVVAFAVGLWLLWSLDTPYRRRMLAAFSGLEQVNADNNPSGGFTQN